MAVTVVGPADLSALSEHLYAEGVVLPAGLGGSPVVEEIRELLDQGREVTLVTLSPSVVEPVVIKGPKLTAMVGPYRPEWRRRALDAFAVERRAIRDMVQYARPDAVHAHWAYEFALGALASGTPTLVTLHDAPLAVLRLDRSFYRQVRTAMAVVASRRGQQWTAVSPYVRDHWRRSLRLHTSPSVVPNPVSVGMSAATPRDSGPQKLMYVANGFSRRKNAKKLLAAFAEARAQVPGFELVLIGAEYEANGIASAYADSAGLSVGVEFAGRLPREIALARMTEEATALVHVALEECCSMTIAEACTLGVPVLGGKNAGGVPWQLQDGAGMLIDVTDKAELRDGIVELCSNLELRRSLRDVGRDRARMYRPTSVVSRYLDLMGKL